MAIVETTIMTIPTLLSPIHADKNGRLFHRETVENVFKKHGYLQPNSVDRITITPINIRFFQDVDSYGRTISSTWNIDRQLLNTSEFNINAEISDKELKAMQVMYMNDRFYLNIPMSKTVRQKYQDYLAKCYAHGICSGLTPIDKLQMGIDDILVFDIFPEDN